VDGTLVDTAELHFQAWQDLFQELKRPFSRADFFSTFGQRNKEILALLLGPHQSEAEMADWSDRKEMFYRARAGNGMILLPGAGKLVADLHAQGFLQGIGSSGPRENIELTLQLTRTRPYFPVLVTLEDTTRGKPDPQVFLLAADRLGVAPRQCLVMEDAVAGIQAAQKAGMKSIGVTFVGHHTPAALRQAGANRVVKNLEEVTVATVRQVLQEEG
jgi:beta-phosphoglucomutase